MSTGSSNMYGPRTIYAGQFKGGTRPETEVTAHVIPCICLCSWAYTGRYPLGIMSLKFRLFNCLAFKEGLHQ